jgi:ERCC4-type nuclease
MKITLQFDGLEDLYGTLNEFLGMDRDLRNASQKAVPFKDAVDHAEQTAKELNESAKKTAEIINRAEAKEEAEKKAKPAPSPEPEVDESYRVEVRKVLAALNKKTGENTASKLIKEFGVDKLTDVKLADLPALMAKAKEVRDA